MLLSRKSPYHHFSQHEHKQSLSLIQKKTKSIYHADAREANDAKYLQENMLDKLLRPPAKKESKGILRKYDPQFPKPDVEKLIHENTVLKSEITENSKLIMELKFKVKQQQKKIIKLESNDDGDLEELLENKKKNPSAHMEILKKKIHDLHTKSINAEAEIKKLKKLPGASIYEENNIQKQHLLAETIRLKSILTSYQNQSIELDSELSDPKQKCMVSQENNSNSLNNAKFQQQFLRMLKQQNEKLKATIRLLQNDKILMKARQTTQNKQSNDLKKELDHLKNKLILRQAEIEKLTHQNQNLLFKKAAKFRLEKEEKENKLIQELTKSIEELRIQKKKLENEKNQLLIDNQELKKKEQAKNAELIEKDKELQRAKFENAQIKNQYQGRINLLQTNKLYSKESGFGSKSSKGPAYSFFNTSAYNLNEIKNFGVDYELVHKKSEEEDGKQKEAGKFNWGKPVKFEELDFCLLKIWCLNEEGIIQSYQDLNALLTQYHSNHSTDKLQKKASITFEELYGFLKSAPICLPSKQSIKLSKYIFSDHSSVPSPLSHVQGDKKQKPIIQISLALTIIKASIKQFTECLNNANVINSWKILLSKSRKFIRELEEYGKETISKEEFVDIVVRNKTNTLLFEEINYMLLHGFHSKISVNQILLNRKKVLQCMYGLMGDPQYLTSMFIRTNLANFMPSSNSNSSSKQISILKYCGKEKQSQINKSNKINNKEIGNEHCNLANPKQLQMNSNYWPDVKNLKQENNKILKTHQPHTLTDKKEHSKMSVELKLLNLKKVNTQSDEGEMKEVHKKIKNYFRESILLPDQENVNNLLHDDNKQNNQECQLDLLDNPQFNSHFIGSDQHSKTSSEKWDHEDLHSSGNRQEQSQQEGEQDEQEEQEYEESSVQKVGQQELADCN